ncbi:MAG: xylose isomerase, partial [Spirochaetota bacterium]
TTGGLNFDAHVRRASFAPDDLLYGHILGIDTYAQGLRVAAKLWEDGILEELLKSRYSAYERGLGADIRAKKLSLQDLEQYALTAPLIHNDSGRQEKVQSVLNRYMDMV